MYLYRTHPCTKELHVRTPATDRETPLAHNGIRQLSLPYSQTHPNMSESRTVSQETSPSVYTCTWEGCDRTYRRLGHMERHRQTRKWSGL